MKGIKREIADLENKIRAEAARMQQVEARFWKEGGMCCPGCGVKGWYDWVEAQERRQKRLEQLKAKLERDSRPQGTGDLVWDTLLGYQKKVDRYFRL
jgi:hypothetical protein